MARYSHLRSDAAGDQSARDLFKVVLSELKVVWEKAGIPIRDDHYCLKILKKLLENKKKMNKIEEERRNEETWKTKISTFKEHLERLCDISAVDAYDKLSQSRRPSWQEDWKFLENQRGNRSFYMTQPDLVVSSYIDRQQQRNNKFDFEKRKTPSSALQLTLNDEQIREILKNATDDEHSADDDLFIPHSKKVIRNHHTNSRSVRIIYSQTVNDAVLHCNPKWRSIKGYFNVCINCTSPKTLCS